MGFEDRLAKAEKTLGEMRSERLRTELDTLDAAAFLFAQFARYLEGRGTLDTAELRAHVMRDLDLNGDERISRINATGCLLRQLDAILATKRGIDHEPVLPR